MTENIVSYLPKIKKAVFMVILAGILPFSRLELNAQDIQATMFNSIPLLLNPSNTGNFEGDWRIAGNFRNQWGATSSPYQTAYVSADAKFYLFNQKFGAGIYFLNDISGIGGLNYNKLYASLAYEIPYRENYFSLGFQVGYVFGSANDWGIFDHGTGNFDAPSGENSFTGKSSYLDLNAGIKWKRSIGIFEPNVGIAAYHLNKPNSSFNEGDEKESMEFVFHTDIKTKLSDEFYLLPTLLYRDKNGASQTVLGTNAGYNFLGNKTSVDQVYAGIYLKNGLFSELDAFSVLVGATVMRIDIAVSYDFNISGLSKTSGKMMGAFEISFIYKSISTVLNSYSIPCERY